MTQALLRRDAIPEEAVVEYGKPYLLSIAKYSYSSGPRAEARKTRRPRIVSAFLLPHAAILKAR